VRVARGWSGLGAGGACEVAASGCDGRRGGVCLLRAAVRREERWAWALLGLGVSAWVGGELYFTVVLWSDKSPPVPSPADAGYLLLPPLVFAGLIVLARSRIRGLPKTLWVDGLTAGLAAGAVSAVVVFEPILKVLGGKSLAVATNLSYPIADLLMLGLVCGLLVVGGRRLDRRFGILAVGIVCFWASDTVYLVKAAHGTWVAGGPYDQGWWAIAVCFAAAAWTKPRRRAAEVPLRKHVPARASVFRAGHAAESATLPSLRELRHCPQHSPAGAVTR
jgi:hypothetical protein